MNALAPKDYIAKRKSIARYASTRHHPEVSIEHHIPIPQSGRRGGARNFEHFYPFEDMTIGDSFWILSDTNCTAGAVSAFAKKSGWKFTTRSQSKDGIPNKTAAKSKRGTRVWRIA